MEGRTMKLIELSEVEILIMKNKYRRDFETSNDNTMKLTKAELDKLLATHIVGKRPKTLTRTTRKQNNIHCFSPLLLTSGTLPHSCGFLPQPSQQLSCFLR